MKDVIIGWLFGFICGITLVMFALGNGNYRPIEKNNSGMYVTHNGALYKLYEVDCD